MPVIRTIEWEWQLRRRRPSAWILGLLLLSALGVAVLVRTKSHLDDRLERSEQQLERGLTRSVTATRKIMAKPTYTTSELRQLHAQIALLNRDWVAFLEELVPGEHEVKLLGLEVNAATGAIRLTGRAISGEEANTYAEALQAQGPSLQDVRLLLLERKADGIHFEVSARWPD